MSQKKDDKELKKSKEEELEAKRKAEEEAKEDEDNDDDTEGDDSDEDENEDSEDGDSSSKKIDYKKIAEEERLKREKAENLLAGDRFKRKHNRDEEVDDEEDDGDKPLTKKDLARILASESKKNQLGMYADRISDIADELSDSPEEALAIIAVHSNRTWPEDISLKEQLEEAHAIVNRKRSSSKLSEMRRALKSKDNRSNDGSSAHQDGQRGTAPKMSKADEKVYTSAGFKFNVKSGLYEKKLPNGKTLFKNPKNKTSWVR